MVKKKITKKIIQDTILTERLRIPLNAKRGIKIFKSDKTYNRHQSKIKLNQKIKKGEYNDV